MQAGDLVRHIKMGPNCITPGLVINVPSNNPAFIPKSVTILWAGDTVLTHCREDNLEVISEVRSR